ncbi:hypothetical protein [Corynebacterium freiburgense]|uniref:hypothetical protein n=1 Tax=Corynebacterium freiburgense TaxID=556548 RepID=UPI000410B286|nr:hypothetical protein [Corynebacterium freiburgense]WJZ03438.1 hypothetical protein CFREI_10830 [Corynebacterium freiburgense]
MAQLQVTAGHQGVIAMLQRAQRIDAQTLARIRQRSEFVDVFVQTPFGVFGSRTATGNVTPDGAVVRASELIHALDGQELPDASVGWQGILPPPEGFQLIDQIPAAVVMDLARKGKDLTRQFSGPMGPPASLLNQEVLQVMDGTHSVGIPMRMIFAAVNLGFVPDIEAEVPRYLRVSSHHRWVRLDAAFGSVWFPQGGINLF